MNLIKLIMKFKMVYMQGSMLYYRITTCKGHTQFVLHMFLRDNNLYT